MAKKGRRTRMIGGLRWECLRPGHWRCVNLQRGDSEIHLFYMMAGTSFQQWEVWRVVNDDLREMIGDSLDMEGAVNVLIRRGIYALLTESKKEAEDA